MHSDFEAIEQRYIKAMLLNSNKPDIVLYGSEEGFEVFVIQDKRTFKLHTQRKKSRLFRSPTTAIAFLAELGVERVVIEGLDKWIPEFTTKE